MISSKIRIPLFIINKKKEIIVTAESVPNGL